MSSIFAFLFYLAAVVFICGLLWKIVGYAKTPVHGLLPIAPAPQTYRGVLWKMLRETLFFESLFRASKWTWLFGWVFHYALALVLTRHLFFVVDPVAPWIALLFFPGDIAAWLMVIALLGLLGRRMVVERVRYISTVSDYAMLVLLLLIGGSGLVLRYLMPADIIGTRNFMLGLIDLSLVALPNHMMLYIHLASVLALVVIFPFSKLVHFPGYFFSPSHNQKYQRTKFRRGN